MRIICRAPVRINLANGGDTDYYVKEIGWGCVVNATLSSHFYEIEINDETGKKIDIIDYFNPSNLNRTYLLDSDVSELDLLKATSKTLCFGMNNSFILRTNAPMQSGLGGSSALNVAMISAMLRYKNESFDAKKVAELAYHIERNVLRVPGGYQDQYASAFGCGFNYMEFKDGKVGVQNLNLPEETIRRLESNLLLYYFSKRETSGSDVHNNQKEMAENNKETTKRLLVEKRTNAVKIKEALISGRLDEFGRLLMREGEIKALLSGEKGCGFAKEAMQLAVEAGALGCKVSGAGGGGCVLFYVPEEKVNKVREVISRTGAIELPFRFQRSFEPGIILKGTSI